MNRIQTELNWKYFDVYLDLHIFEAINKRKRHVQANNYSIEDNRFKKNIHRLSTTSRLSLAIIARRLFNSSSGIWACSSCLFSFVLFVVAIALRAT